jgi:diguanylate cyclase (GGDEF)-like protein
MSEAPNEPAERRLHPGRRLGDLVGEAEFWMPERHDIVVQFFTRYLFFVLGVLFFSTLEHFRPILFGVDTILFLFGGYFLLNTWFFTRALKGLTLMQLRGAMALDMFMVTISVIHDPSPVPPSALAFLMVLLGNGMRYGMRLFAETLVASLLGMAIAFGLRYRLGGFDVGSGDVFFGVFWITLATYAYVLMGRIDRQRRELDYRSRFDALTGLLNRHGLLAATDPLFREAHARQPAVLFADLDRFKHVNDQYGHVAGDRVLAEFARILAEATDGAVCGRWGGDEFVAVLDEGGHHDLDGLMARISARAESWSRANGLPMSASLGASRAPQDGTDLVTLLAVADVSLYRGKRPDGRGFSQHIH